MRFQKTTGEILDAYQFQDGVPEDAPRQIREGVCYGDHGDTLSHGRKAHYHVKARQGDILFRIFDGDWMYLNARGSFMARSDEEFKQVYTAQENQ
jgi:hypothetical protein